MRLAASQTRRRNAYAALVFSLLPFSLSTTVYYVNQVSEYSALPSCAATPVSDIVRDMKSGCGDGGSDASYSCFCTASSTRFSSIISTAVESQCGEKSVDAVSNALNVFHSYCQLAITAATTTTTAVSSTGTTASPLSRPSALSTTSPPTNFATPNSKSPLSTGAKAAIGICVPLAVLVAGAAAFIFFRRRGSVHNYSRSTSAELPPYTNATPELPNAEAAELGSYEKNSVHELSSAEPAEFSYKNFVHEMPNTEAHELP